MRLDCSHGYTDNGINGRSGPDLGGAPLLLLLVDVLPVLLRVLVVEPPPHFFVVVAARLFFDLGLGVVLGVRVVRVPDLGVEEGRRVLLTTGSGELSSLLSSLSVSVSISRWSQWFLPRRHRRHSSSSLSLSSSLVILLLSVEETKVISSTGVIEGFEVAAA